MTRSHEGQLLELQTALPDNQPTPTTNPALEAGWLAAKEFSNLILRRLVPRLPRSYGRVRVDHAVATAACAEKAKNQAENVTVR